MNTSPSPAPIRGLDPGSSGFRRQLLVPVVSMVVLAFTLAALLGALFGTRATEFLVQQLVAKENQGLRTHLQRFLEKPHLTARVNADAMNSGQVDVHSLFQRPESWFLDRLRQFPEVDDIYFGRSDGAIVGVDKIGDRRILKLTTAFPKREFFELDSEGRRGAVIGSGNYDATQRDWYRAAMGNRGPAWSEIYVLQNRHELGISAAHPAHDLSGRPVGVMGVNLTLASLSEYLRNHPVGPGSVSYIVEPSGMLVATSAAQEPVIRGSGGERSRVAASQAPNPLIASSHQALLQINDSAPKDQQARPIDISVDGRTLWVYLTRYGDPIGLDWRLVTVVDPAPFLQSVHRVALITVLLGAAALGSLLLVLPRVTRRMAAPLEELARATRSLGQGDYGVSVSVPGGSREIEHLQAAFNDMSQRLSSAHQLLTTQASRLQEEVQVRTSELAQLNDLYKDERNRAEAASANKSRFLTHLSHELRSPLNAIAGQAFLARGDSDRGTLETRLQAIEDAARYVSRMLDAVLDLSRIEAGHIEIARESVDIAGLVAATLNLVEAEAAAKGLSLRSRVDPLPNGLRGDATRMQQCLVNLLNNAVRVTHQGAVTVEVTASSLTPTAAHLCFAVQDTGPGIAPSELERLFNPYAQGAAGRGGAGLGLAITRGLAQLMRGEAAATSSPGHGSRFFFTAQLERTPTTGSPPSPTPISPAVPIPTAAPAPAQRISAADLHGALQERTRPAHILVIDDDAVNLLVAEGILSRVGCRVAAAPSGIEGLLMAEQSAFDLILTDITMPDMDGLAVTRQLRSGERHRRTPIIALTGLAFESDRQRCLEAGMNDVVSKPLEPELLFAKLWHWLVEAPTKT